MDYKMKGGSGMRPRSIGRALVLVLFVAGSSILVAMKMVHKEQHKSDPLTYQRLPKTNHENKQKVDSAISMLRSGYIVLRMGLGADSRLLSQMNRKDKSYSHCGIVMVEDGYPFVYHSIGGEDNPDERLRRDSAKIFFSPRNNIAIAIVTYNFTTGNEKALRKVVSDYYARRPKFDLKFDLKSDDKLYCSEFVYKAINKTMQDTTYIRPTEVAGLRFVGIDDLFVNPHAHIVWQTVFK